MQGQVGADAETEARLCGTAFFKIIEGRVYFLRPDPGSGLWEVYAALADGL